MISASWMNLFTDGTGEFNGRHMEFVKNFLHMHIHTKYCESGRKTQIFTEGEIGILSHQAVKTVDD
jgi:hypothetical protein